MAVKTYVREDICHCTQTIICLCIYVRTQGSLPIINILVIPQGDNLTKYGDIMLEVSHTHYKTCEHAIQSLHTQQRVHMDQQHVPTPDNTCLSK